MKQAVLLLGVGAGALLLLVLVLPKAAQAAKGVVSGDNDLTRNATNAQGEAVNAYLGAGFVGTAGAAANLASGGWLSTAGGWVGRTVYDVTHPDPERQRAEHERNTRPQDTPLETIGGWLGRTAWDVFNPDPMAVMNHTKTEAETGQDTQPAGLPDYFAA